MLKAVRSSALVSPEYLANRWRFNETKQCTILDCSWHLPNTGRDARQEYEEKHIPRALFFDIEECSDKTSSFPHMLPEPSVFEKYVKSLGVNIKGLVLQKHRIFLYDNHPQFGMFSAPRVWWMFRSFGFNEVQILEGGLPSWIEYGGLVTNEKHDFDEEEQYFMAKTKAQYLKSYEDMIENVNNKGKLFKVIDARPKGRFNGTAPEPRNDIKSGHIPFSVNIPFTEVLESENRLMKPTNQLLDVFTEAKVDLDKPLAFSCGTGVTASIVGLAAFICGKRFCPIYDGSWTEYYQRAPDNLKSNVPSE